MQAARPAGRYGTVPLNGEIIVLPGNLKPGIFAGLSTEPFVRGSVRISGTRRSKFAENVKFFEQ